jgi:hypothetical protein
MLPAAAFADRDRAAFTRASITSRSASHQTGASCPHNHQGVSFVPALREVGGGMGREGHLPHGYPSLRPEWWMKLRRVADPRHTVL